MGCVVDATPLPTYPPPLEIDLIPTVQEAKLAAGQVWTSEENIAPTGVRSPDRPDPSENAWFNV